MKRHIVQVVQHLRPGGLECLVLDLARHSSCETTIVALEGSREETLSAWPRLAEFSDRVHFLSKQPGLRPGLIVELARLFRRIGATVVHTHHVGPLLYGGAAARLAGIDRLVHTEHDAWHLGNRKRRMVVGAAVAALRPTLVADAPFVARAVSASLQIPEPVVVTNGIDMKQFVPGDHEAARARLGLPADVALLGTAARLEEVKGVDILIEAMPAFPEVHLAIAGDGSLRKDLEELAHQLEISDRVHFLGRVDEMTLFYQAIDRYCLTSRAEGLPLSILEAQACAIPVVATNVGGVADATDRRSGFIAAHPDRQSVVDALTGSLGLMRVSNPRDFVSEAFSLERMIKDYEELWHGAVFAPEQDLASA